MIEVEHLPNNIMLLGTVLKSEDEAWATVLQIAKNNKMTHYLKLRPVEGVMRDDYYQIIAWK